LTAYSWGASFFLFYLVKKPLAWALANQLNKYEKLIAKQEKLLVLDNQTIFF